MQHNDSESLLAAISALESQRATLGDAVVETATAPLRAQLAATKPAAGKPVDAAAAQLPHDAQAANSPVG